MKDTVKEIQALGMPWEKEYGYAQGIKCGNLVWLAGQVGHDENGNLLTGMEAQMDQAYSNIRKLLQSFDMEMDTAVEEVLYVLDIKAAFEARKNMGRKWYPDPMKVASTLVEVTKLALENQVVEIKIIAHL